MIRLQALGTLTEELHNPEKCYRAFNNFLLIKRITDLLINNPKPMCPVSLERAILNIALVATYVDGAMKIVVELKLLQFLYDHVKANDCVSLQAASTFAILSSHTIGTSSNTQ